MSISVQLTTQDRKSKPRYREKEMERTSTEHSDFGRWR
jgi:hypothetical protein